MKRKMIALVLGLALVFTNTAGTFVFAEETTAQEQIPGETPEGQPPQMPDGQAPGEMPEGQPPQMPDGQAPGEMPEGQPPQMPDGQAPGEMPEGQPPEGMGAGPGGMNGGGASGVDSYDAVNEYTSDASIDGEDILSEGTDENAVLVSGEDAAVTVSGSTVTRNSSDSSGGDNASFYGVGAAMLATAGKLTISGTTISTDAAGAAGAFAYGDGVVCISDSVISTQQNTSGGIHAAGGGTLYAWNLDVTTNGGSAAAIRSDRGGGTMVVDGGTYTSNGSGSPAIYCTADISVHDAQLTASGSEAICIEGLNTIRLFDCDLNGNMPENDQNDVTWNVIVYQSMSGDSEVGNGTFEMDGGTLTANNGGMFYTTNTESTITLRNVEITYSEDNPFFLQVTGNANARGWGQTGSNGADCLFTAIEQDMKGDVIWDSVSNLDLYMTNCSTLTGAIVNDETWAGDGGEGYCAVNIDETSTWIVTGDSTVTTLNNAGTIMDENGDTVSIVGTDGTVYAEGSGEYTVTVSSYADSVDTSPAGTIGAWEDYQVEIDMESTT